MIRTQGAKRSVLPLSSTPIPLSECHPQALHPLPEDSKDHARHHSDYAHNLSQNPRKPSKFDLELRMLRERDTDKVKRTENRVRISQHSSLRVPTPLCPLPTFSRAFFAIAVFRFPSLSSDVQPSSMVSFAEVVWLRVQRQKSDAHAPPTRSRRCKNQCKAPPPSQTAVTLYKTMVQHSSLHQLNVSQSLRRQGHSPQQQSLQNTSTRSYLNSLQAPRRLLASPSWAPLTSSASQKTRNLEKRLFSV